MQYIPVPVVRVFFSLVLSLAGLVAALKLLKMGGRCAVLTFSPPERRAVHDFFRRNEDVPPEDLQELSPQRCATVMV